MPLAGQQAGCGIEPDPARAGQVHFGPGVQIGEIGGGAGGAFERLDVGRELNQIAGNEARGEPQMPQDLDQKPGRVAAGAGAQGKRLFARLHAGLQADHVADVALQPLVEANQEIDGADFSARYLSSPPLANQAASLAPAGSVSRNGRNSRASAAS